MKLSKLNESFIKHARDNDISRVPIFPTSSPHNRPIIPVERWEEIDGKLCKTYLFRNIAQKNAMIKMLLNYETSIKHFATMLISEHKLKLQLSTKTIDKITELDKEYAKYADQIFKDVISQLRGKEDDAENNYDW